MRKNNKIAVVMGGISSERNISLMSGHAVLSGLYKENINAYAFDTKYQSILNIKKYNFDKVFISLHGRGGEDGKIQAVLDVLNLPYTGSGVMASSIAIDKIRTKLLWKGYGLQSSNFIWLTYNQIMQGLDKNTKHSISMLGLPLFVKPNREGSSIGISKVNTMSELPKALKKALHYDQDIIIEQFLNGEEYTICILGNQILPIIKITTNNKFYNYQAKYLSDNTKYHFSNNLSIQQELKLKKLASSAWNSLGCTSYGRIDVMTNNEGEFYLLEVNTSPGMTAHSLFPLAAEKAGIPFSKLIINILELSINKNNFRKT
ncbi:D-alanine--D-alanine ligase [Candidatus Pantoea edessiphila]|uniref:D-alanine--D-alanine ligase n=1 Tax=Candidatus Pantoea edessiphila TaxID=2044610 RepID=A0A2P5SY23_9GAMM|nr:D-alanine--D-alanine ligase [Candidatus Pantoea edessiphila]MBK4775588.1 D-alanine--D-alanine ligase [Pantoea sp. Edef]PPI87239.1 D-alanine--D-alanine ligase [Candidatus Pantoea edessiphila]